MTEPNYALEQAKAQYESICEMVAALEVDYDRLDELKSEFESEITGDERAEWIKKNSVEFTDLGYAAGDCENRDAARERIQQDPLSVQVRSGWYNPCDSQEAPEEFEILLCTGGPAVRIIGELDEHNEPSRAWLEYQDWGTPWQRYFDAEQDTLLAYCREFYFGG